MLYINVVAFPFIMSLSRVFVCLFTLLFFFGCEDEWGGERTRSSSGATSAMRCFVCILCFVCCLSSVMMSKTRSLILFANISTSIFHYCV